MHSRSLALLVAAIIGLGIGTAYAQQDAGQQRTVTEQPQTGQGQQSEGTQMKMTDDEAKAWIGQPVYDSEGNEVGEVADLVRQTDGSITELHVDSGGFLGIGEQRLQVQPNQFQVAQDRIVLNLTKAETEVLPKVEEERAAEAPQQ